MPANGQVLAATPALRYGGPVASRI